MYHRSMFLAIVPARGGSKGIPGKNLKELCGVPLIGRTINEAKRSKYLDRIIVSTDDRKIADVALSFGADVPFLRPAELAADTSPTIDTVLHVMSFVEEAERRQYDFVILLQPTSPFRTAIQIDSAISVLMNSTADSLISFKRAQSNPYWMVTKTSDGRFQKLLTTEKATYQRQLLPDFYEYNGSIYCCAWNSLVTRKAFESDTTLLFEMDDFSSIDIDTPDDWDYAEWIASRRGLV